MIPVAKRINHLLKAGNSQQLKAYLTTLHPADIAHAISRHRPEEILFILETVSNTRSIKIFSELEPDTQKNCIELSDPEKVVHFFTALSSDEQTDLVKILAPEVREELLSLLKRSEREDLIRLSRYEEGTAGAEMTTEFFALHSNLTVEQAITEIKKQSETVETIYSIYIVDDRGRLEGVLSLKDLVLAKPDRTLRQIMNPNVISVVTSDDVEYVAEKISKYDLLALPVVNPAKALVGIVTVDDVLDIMEEEATEDFYALGAAGAPIDYLGSSVWKISRQRITWLLALAVSGIIAGIVMELAGKGHWAFVQLAFFIPMLSGSGGNAGTQTTTVIVRGLATGEINTSFMGRILWKEVRVGFIVGLAMAAITALRAVLLHHQGWHFVITVGVTMIAVVTFAKTIGSILPMIFKKMNLDPALMSGPLLASLVDIFSLLIFFGLAWWLLPPVQ